MGTFGQIGLVALGGAIGSLVRWGVTIAFARMMGTSFPWGTFVINVTGCLFLGWFSTVLVEKMSGYENLIMSVDSLRLSVAVGFTGAYTTFSTFEFEAHSLLRDGDGFLGMTYLFGSVFVGLICVRVGMLLARL